MAIDYSVLPLSKGKTRKQLKARAKRGTAEFVSEVRQYVFARERGMCRCCRLRPAESMHEIRARSLRARVGKTNSIAVCGSGTTKCHGYLQSKQIHVEQGSMGAEGGLFFAPTDRPSREWMRLPSEQCGLESLPMRDMESDT